MRVDKIEEILGKLPGPDNLRELPERSTERWLCSISVATTHLNYLLAAILIELQEIKLLQQKGAGNA